MTQQAHQLKMIESAGGLRIAAQVPDQHIGIDQHGG